MEITWKLWKAGFQWNVGLENAFSTEILFSIRVLHTVFALYNSWNLKKGFRKGCYNEKTSV